MWRKLKRNNVEMILEVREIPRNMRITRLPDGLESERFSGVFTGNLKLAEEYQGASGIPGIGRLGIDSPGRGVAFFIGLRFSLRRYLHESREDFMLFVIGDEDDG
jgi:hypothetical protein